MHKMSSLIWSISKHDCEAAYSVNACIWGSNVYICISRINIYFQVSMFNILKMRGRRTTSSIGYLHHSEWCHPWGISPQTCSRLSPPRSSEAVSGTRLWCRIRPPAWSSFTWTIPSLWSWILIMPNYSSTRYTFTSHYNNKRIKDLGKFHQIIEVCYNILWNTYPGMFSDIVVTIGRSLTRAYCYGSRPKSSYNVCYTFHNQCQKWCMVEDDVIYRSQIILATLALEIERAQERHRKIFWHNEISGSRQVVQRIVVKINISFDQQS